MLPEPVRCARLSKTRLFGTEAKAYPSKDSKMLEPCDLQHCTTAYLRQLASMNAKPFLKAGLFLNDYCRSSSIFPGEAILKQGTALCIMQGFHWHYTASSSFSYIAFQESFCLSPSTSRRRWKGISCKQNSPSSHLKLQTLLKTLHNQLQIQASLD